MILRRLAFQVQFHNSGNSKAVIATRYFLNPAWTTLQTLLAPCLTESVEGAPKCEGQFKPSFKSWKWLRLNGWLDKHWPDDWKYGGWCEQTRQREMSWWAGKTTGNGSGPTGLMQVDEEHKNTEQTATSLAYSTACAIYFNIFTQYSGVFSVAGGVREHLVTVTKDPNLYRQKKSH